MSILLLVLAALRQDAPDAGQADELVRASVSGTSLDARMDPPNGSWPAIDTDGERCIVGLFDAHEGPSCFGRDPSWRAPPSGPGRASVYVRTPDGWVLEADLRSQGESHPRGFGYAVAIHGRAAVVSTVREHGLGDEAGATRLYERTEANGWQHVSTLLPENEDDFVGCAVDAADGTVAIGVRQEAGNGQVRILERGATGWAEVARLEAPSAHASDFATSVALRGDTLLVGAPLEFEYIDAWATGAAYVVERRADGSWQLVQRLAVEGALRGDQFGALACFVAEDELVLGTSPYGTGAARVCFFRRTPAGWVQEQALEIAAAIDGRPGPFALASDADRVYVGTPYDDHGGTVHVLAREGGRWARRTAWSLSAAEGSRFGLALAAPGGSLLTSCRRPRPTGALPSCAGILDVSTDVHDR